MAVPLFEGDQNDSRYIDCSDMPVINGLESYRCLKHRPMERFDSTRLGESVSIKVPRGTRFPDVEEGARVPAHVAKYLLDNPDRFPEAWFKEPEKSSPGEEAERVLDRPTEAPEQLRQVYVLCTAAPFETPLQICFYLGVCARRERDGTISTHPHFHRVDWTDFPAGTRILYRK